MRPPLAVVVHRAPGRLRLRVPARRGDTDFLGKIGNALRERPGVSAVEVNPLTGSLLVRFTGDERQLLAAVPAIGLRLGDIVEAAAEEAEAHRAATPTGSPIDRMADTLDDIDAELQRSSEGRMDLPSATLLYLVGAGFVQLLRGRVLPSAHTLFAQAGRVAWRRREERKKQTDIG